MLDKCDGNRTIVKQVLGSLANVILAVAIAAVFWSIPTIPSQSLPTKTIDSSEFEIGVRAIQRGDYSQAIVNFTRSIENDLHVTAAYSNRCLARLYLGDARQAAEDCTQAIQQGEISIETYLNRGLARYRLGEYQASIADFDRVLGLNLGDWRGYYNRGLARVELIEYERAIADFGRALHYSTSAEKSQQSAIYIDRGLAYLMLEKTGEAIDNFDRAIAIDDRSSRAYYNRACTCHRHGEFQQALKDFTRVIALEPNSAQAYANRGFIHENLGNASAALQDWQTAAELFRQQGAITASQKIRNLLESRQFPVRSIG